ncbi:MAG: NblA-related protein [Okeania sp. SIO2H7]|nr:NblA-related protein [Okeania sp. SIO2H7]
MDKHIELPLEKQFSIRSFETTVRKMNLQQAQDFLVELYEQMLIKETLYQQFLKQQWGIESSPGVE